VPANLSDDYQTVAERIKIFRDKYPEGSLRPADLAYPFRLIVIQEQNYVVVTAAAYRHPEDKAPGIGQAWEMIPGNTEYTYGSELMVCETGAWGRAIIAVLAADSRKIASADEVKAAQQRRNPTPRQAAAPEPVTAAPEQRTITTTTPEKNPFDDDSEGNRDLVTTYIAMMKDTKTTREELREVWEVLSQAGLLARRVEPFGGIAPEGDGKVTIGSLVGHIGRQKG